MKRSRDQARGSKEPLPLAALNKQNQHLTQTSLKEHFRVTKPRHAGKENASDAAVLPTTKTIKSPMLMAPMSRRLAAMLPAPVPLSLMPSAATPSAATPASSSAPVLSECGISLSTAPFEFPAPSEDTAATADISSRLPSHGAGKAGLLLLRQRPSAGPAQPTTDTDEISCRHRPLSARPACLLNRANSAATFSSDACGAGSVAQQEYSTASLASWLPGKGTSSMQAAAACAAEESDCEDDAVSQRWTMMPPAAATALVAPASILPDTIPAQTGPGAAVHAAGSGGRQAQLLPSLVIPTSDLTAHDAAACPVSGSEESDGGADFMPVMLELAQGGAVAGPAGQQEAGRVMYHTRLEELLFGMNYVAPATDETDGAEE